MLVAAENLCDIIHANSKEILETRHEVDQIVSKGTPAVKSVSMVELAQQKMEHSNGTGT